MNHPPHMSCVQSCELTLHRLCLAAGLVDPGARLDVGFIIVHSPSGHHVAQTLNTAGDNWIWLTITNGGDHILLKEVGDALHNMTRAKLKGLPWAMSPDVFGAGIEYGVR
jgi:hypothetical protein